MKTYALMLRDYYGGWRTEWTGDDVEEFLRQVKDSLNDELEPHVDFIAVKHEIFPADAHTVPTKDDLADEAYMQFKDERPFVQEQAR